MPANGARSSVSARAILACASAACAVGDLGLRGGDRLRTRAGREQVELGLRPAHLRFSRRHVSGVDRCEQIELGLRPLHAGPGRGDVRRAGALLQLRQTGLRRVVRIGGVFQLERFRPETDVRVSRDPVVSRLGLAHGRRGVEGFGLRGDDLLLVRAFQRLALRGLGLGQRGFRSSNLGWQRSVSNPIQPGLGSVQRSLGRPAFLVA